MSLLSWYPCVGGCLGLCPSAAPSASESHPSPACFETLLKGLLETGKQLVKGTIITARVFSCVFLTIFPLKIKESNWCLSEIKGVPGQIALLCGQQLPVVTVQG